ncbi:NAD(P)H-quinone oxidoreductase [Pedobacter antarcticus]|uniref:NAD(P)H-quinone oxidoreductase n=1 Tax=Pedobacter antarcticus TaxID=34086 RepID=UPI00088EBCC8|nr:NAD(P)H-quinone oxidoreductase [Pedobacter antarcticus]SDM37330.1 putative NAD(P)H quinone oxidoreductase, PIG3 family [Pedobacter antarcticus]
MKAIVYKQTGGPEVLDWNEYPTPVPHADEVLIHVRAAGVNRPDVFQRKGGYPAPAGAPANIPGLEVAGIVVGCGPSVKEWKLGDEVCALLNGGGYAEYAIAREGQCLPKPKGLDFIQAASLPETLFTVWSNIFERGNLQPGEKLLIHGGSSGIGITSIQLATALGFKVYVTVGSEEKGQECLSKGAIRFVNYKTQDFAVEYAQEGIDVILDMVGGDYLNKNVNILNPDGRVVYINSIKGEGVLDLAKVMVKRLIITGSTLRSRPYEFKKKLAGEIYKNVWAVIESGKFVPAIFKTFLISDAADAHRLMESGEHTGKIVLTNLAD